VYVLVVPDFADWEPAHALAELRRYGGYIEVVGLTMAPVECMGGVRVLPARLIAEVDPADVVAFILPGGDRWETTPLEPELEDLLQKLDAAGVPLAAICGATVAVARAGRLRRRGSGAAGNVGVARRRRRRGPARRVPPERRLDPSHA